MSNATAELAAGLRASAEEVRERLSVRVLTSHGHIITRDGHPMDVARLDDGTATATIATPTSATRWTRQDAEALAAAFEGEAPGTWRAEYWRDVATRWADELEELADRIDNTNTEGDA